MLMEGKVKFVKGGMLMEGKGEGQEGKYVNEGKGKVCEGKNANGGKGDLGQLFTSLGRVQSGQMDHLELLPSGHLVCMEKKIVLLLHGMDLVLL